MNRLLVAAMVVIALIGSRAFAQDSTPKFQVFGGYSLDNGKLTGTVLDTASHEHNGPMPISTTHAIAGAISGVGATRGWHAVRWVWARRIVHAWVLTFPGAALVGAAGYWLAHLGIEPVIAH